MSDGAAPTGRAPGWKWLAVIVLLGAMAGLLAALVSAKAMPADAWWRDSSG